MPSTKEYAVFTIAREYKAPRAAVWKAWSEAESLRQWWGPKGCAIDVLCREFRPGGLFHYSMQFDGAPTMWGRFIYREIVPQERIVWLNSFATEGCGIERAPFSPICPLEVQNTVIFAERDGMTTVALHATPFGAADVERRYFEDLKPSLEQGYGGTFDQLGEYLQRK